MYLEKQKASKFVLTFVLTGISFFSLPVLASNATNTNHNTHTQTVIQNANPNIAIDNENNPNFSNNNSIAVNNNSNNPVPLSTPRPFITVAPAVQAVQLPQTGSTLLVSILLFSLFPIGIRIRKLA